MNMPTSDEASETVQGSQLSSPLPIVPRASGTVRWHLLTIAAGCALTAMFFLPLDDLRKWSNSSEVPAKVVVEMLGRASIQSLSFHAELLVLVAYVFSLAVLPHVWGLLMVLYSLGSLLELRWLRALPHALGVFIGVALGATSIVGMTFYLPRFLSQLGGGGANYYVALALSGITMLFAVLGVLHALLAIRRGRWAYLYHGFAGAGVLVYVFTVMNTVLALAGGWRYVGMTGLTVTWFVSCLLLFSRIGEARAVSSLTWCRMLWYLLTLRLPKTLRPVGLCPGCGYNLYGLREQRCPECGRPFTFEEVFSTPASLGFAGASSPDTA